MARLGRKAQQQIDHERQRPPPQKGSIAQNIVSRAVPGPQLREASSTSHQGRQTMSFPQADTDNISDRLPAMAVGSPFPPTNDLDSMVHGLTDIDTLFGEFLDLSLPTTFWDPMFGEDPSGQG